MNCLELIFHLGTYSSFAISAGAVEISHEGLHKNIQKCVRVYVLSYMSLDYFDRILWHDGRILCSGACWTTFAQFV